MSTQTVVIREGESVYMSVAAFSKYIGIGQTNVRQFVRDGMPHLRVGQGIRIHRADAEAWLRSRAKVNTVSQSRRARSSASATPVLASAS